MNFNPNCEKTYCTFRLVGDELIPQQITEILSIQPTFAHAKGETFESRSGVLKRPTGVWAYSTEDILHSSDLEYHIQYLLNELESHSNQIEKFISQWSLKADFFCYWLSATGHGGPEISPQTLAGISKLGAILGFDFYGPYD